MARKERTGAVPQEAMVKDLVERPVNVRAERANWDKPSGYIALRFMDDFRPRQSIPDGYYTKEELERKIQKGTIRKG